MSMKLNELKTIIDEALIAHPEFGDVNVIMLSGPAWSPILQIAELNQPWGQNIVFTGTGVVLSIDPGTVTIYRAANAPPST